MNTKLNVTVGFIAFAAALAGCNTGFAQNASAARSVSETVTYSDLNLSTSTGVRTLYRRIVTAALDVCGPDPEDLVSAAVERACETKAISEAVATIGQPGLIALYNAGHRYYPIALRVAGLQSR